MSGKKNIANSPELRLKGWRAALRSDKVPAWLKDSIRANVRRLSKRLKRRREKKGVGLFG